MGGASSTPIFQTSLLWRGTHVLQPSLVQDVVGHVARLATATAELPPLLAVFQHLQDFVLEHRQLVGIAGREVVEDPDVLGHGWGGFVAPVCNGRG